MEIFFTLKSFFLWIQKTGMISISNDTFFPFIAEKNDFCTKNLPEGLLTHLKFPAGVIETGFNFLSFLDLPLCRFSETFPTTRSFWPRNHFTVFCNPFLGLKHPKRMSPKFLRNCIVLCFPAAIYYVYF